MRKLTLLLVAWALAAIGLPVQAAAQVDGTDWLGTVNAYRAAAGLQPVVEDPDASRAAAAHARYMVETGDVGHSEDPASPWYTPEGDEAARSSNVFGGSATSLTDAANVESDFATVFHGTHLLNPALSAVGYGVVREPGAPSGVEFASALHVFAGFDSSRPVSFPQRRAGSSSRRRCTCSPASTRRGR